MRDDEGILFGRGRLDLGSEAAIECEFGLVLVNDTREVAHGRRREPGLGDQQPLESDGLDVIFRQRR